MSATIHEHSGHFPLLSAHHSGSFAAKFYVFDRPNNYTWLLQLHDTTTVANRKVHQAGKATLIVGYPHKPAHVKMVLTQAYLFHRSRINQLQRMLNILLYFPMRFPNVLI